MTGAAAVSGSTPQERREALRPLISDAYYDARNDGNTMEYAADVAADGVSRVAESWLTKKDNDVNTLSFIIEAHEIKVAEKDAEIERLRIERDIISTSDDVNNAEIERLRNDLRETEALVPDPESVERELDDRLADERRRTAERVKDQVHAHVSTLALVRITYLDVARICDEVGGSDDE